MKIFKVRNVKTPNRGTKVAAGIDFFVPEKDSFYIKNPSTGELKGPFEQYTVFPQESILIPSGIKARVPEGFALVAFNKSGVSTKKNLIKGAEVVDEDYQGEIHIHIINSGSESQIIEAGDKLIQFSLIAQNYESIEEVESESSLFEQMESDRGVGGFGSTGVK